MKFIDMARVVIPVMAALVSHTAFAQFTNVSRSGQLEARPGAVVDLSVWPEGTYWFDQGSSDPACSPPRCTENFYHVVSAFSNIEPNSLIVSTSIYAGGSPVDLVNKGELSVTFDVAGQTDVLLTLQHGVSLDGTGLAPIPSSYSFGRLLSDGSFESIALPTLSSGSLYAEEQLNLTLQAGRYVMTSRIEFNSSLYFPTGVGAGGTLGEGGSIQITQVPEPGTLALLGMGLVFLVGQRTLGRRVA